MKKCTLNTLMAILLLMPTLVAFSQDHTRESRSLIFSEDFSGGMSLPSGWSIVGDGQTNWKVAASKFAGGVAPEVVMESAPTFTGNSKLVSPQIATSAYSSVILQFNHFLYNYAGGSSISVETSSDGVTWHQVWSVNNITAAILPETVFITINNGDVGSDNFQIAFKFSGTSGTIISWNIDNIMLNENLNHDAEATHIFVPTVSGDNLKIPPMGVVTNKGSEAASFDVTLEILNETSAIVYNKTMTVTNLPSFESKVLNFPAWTSVVGNYTVNLKTNLAGDENAENNLVSSSMDIQQGVIFNKPLYEEFTSSTCSPCAYQNPALDAVLATNHTSHSLIKYQVDFPGSGDPYYTPECNIRKLFYANSSAPSLYINSVSKWVAGMTQAIYDSFLGLPAKMDIDIVTATIDPSDMVVTIEANINVIENLAAGLTAHIAIVEKTTTGNVGSNGEKEFFNVMMKMLPNASGTTLGALSVGNTVSLTQSYDMDLTFMEEHTDLAVVVFVQDNSNKNVLQSEMMDISIPMGIENNPLLKNTVKLFPNPASGNINLDSDMEIEQIIIFNLMGQIVYESSPRTNSLNIDISNLKPGLYLFKMINAEGSVVKQIVVI